ncbi:MAG: 5-formyltetrahydrofolate cyclo-ligase [Candidatus Omnitrophica bacterium]|nr:5-formyltetrahydrofolate cyclo-ligase [Candidatus Omnitrophota bacterium]MDD5351585.1 5-formyltetrahydrofolate cyclo-ligase [Candidatus Omnitrophota bacterium]MDD5551020.1 5-formyltetrahydrofolate cyclo-ligase [Candidatus Omnitrophota bacterium]
MIKRTKNYIRSQLLKRLKKQKEVEQLKRSFKIQNKLFSLPEFIKAKMILFYLSFGGEVETFRMIQKTMSLGKKVALPVINSRNKRLIPSLISDCGYNLELGPYGIRQPKKKHMRNVALDKIDLIIVPGVAFDLHGNRIGRGLGYYDRFLHSLPKEIPSIGLAFDFQVLGRIPSLESHDFPVDKVLHA